MARARRATRLMSRADGGRGLALRKFVTILQTNLATRVNYSLIRSDFVFSNVVFKGIKVASFRLFTMLTRKGVSVITMQATRHNQHFKPARIERDITKRFARSGRSRQLRGGELERNKFTRTSSLNKFTSTGSPVQAEAMPMQPTFPTPCQVTQKQPIVDTLPQKQQ